MDDNREAYFAFALSAFLLWFVNFVAHVKSANPKNFNQEGDAVNTDGVPTGGAVDVEVGVVPFAQSNDSNASHCG